MSQDAGAELKDVELNELDPEKQPMKAAGEEEAAGEQNGCVKVKMPEEAEAKFTGLSKEELLRVAGTPGWVRTRWALLVLFWLGWVGMLVGAVVIIVQAPRCRPLPPMRWWNEGPLYEIGDPQAFVDDKQKPALQAMEDHINSLSQLKIKGLVLGSLHKAPTDSETDLSLDAVDGSLGTLDNFKSFVSKAQGKGISVVVDLTPNYRGQMPWYSDKFLQDPSQQAKIKGAFDFWLGLGVKGIQVSGLDHLVDKAPALWEELWNKTKWEGSEPADRVLIGVTALNQSDKIMELQNRTQVDLLLSGLLRLNQDALDLSVAVEALLTGLNQSRMSWNVGGRSAGHLASLVPQRLVRLYHLLLFTLPGTPVFNYGDEIGLQDEQGKPFPRMLWNESQDTADTVQKGRLALRDLFRELSELRGRERSLEHGDFRPLRLACPASLAFLREWDQSERYLALLNFANQSAPCGLAGEVGLPRAASVVLSTGPGRARDQQLELADLRLEPSEGLLLRFPYTP